MLTRKACSEDGPQSELERKDAVEREEKELAPEPPDDGGATVTDMCSADATASGGPLLEEDLPPSIRRAQRAAKE